jgi:catechol 2,3-dioxygenase-like lactoylglutathione lyase family enzyme
MQLFLRAGDRRRFCVILGGATTQGKRAKERLPCAGRKASSAWRATGFAATPRRQPSETFMPRVVGVDHLVLSVGDLARSKAFYDKVLGFLGFKLKYQYAEMAGWSNGKTLFWIAAADAQGRKRKYRKGDIGFHHYAFELSSRDDVDALGAFLEKHGMNVVDPPGEYYGHDYYAVYFTDPDGMKLEGMIWAPPPKHRSASRNKKTPHKS